MRFLLDTNIVVWVLGNEPRIEPVREILMNEENDIFISAVSWWEIAIKIRIGKLNVDLERMRLHAQADGYRELPLEGRHTETLANLPRYHKDPFDHILLAQAITEPMRFITGDGVLAQYTPLVMQI